MRKSLVTLSTLVALTFAGAAQAFELEVGVRNSVRKFGGVEYTKTNISFTQNDNYDRTTSINSKTYSFKADVYAPDAGFNFNYKGKGDIKLEGHAYNDPVEPDPTIKIVETETDTKISERAWGNSSARGTTQSHRLGFVYENDWSASSFIKY